VAGEDGVVQRRVPPAVRGVHRRRRVEEEGDGVEVALGAGEVEAAAAVVVAVVGGGAACEDPRELVHVAGGGGVEQRPGEGLAVSGDLASANTICSE
jgi:hypothetical protein